MADIDSEKERRLVADLLEGDESAFCELYALYKDRLMWFSLKFLKSRDMAEDVFQDAFASIWQNRRFLNPNVPFGPYVYTIVKNRILNLLAGLDRELELRDKIRSASLDSTNETEDSVLDTDLNALLDKALETLTPQQKRVFDMSRKDMKSHKDRWHCLSRKDTGSLTDPSPAFLLRKPHYAHSCCSVHNHQVSLIQLVFCS